MSTKTKTGSKASIKSGQKSVQTPHLTAAPASATTLNRPSKPEDVRKHMDLDFDAKERLRNALSILNNHQLLMKYAVENKQVWCPSKLPALWDRGRKLVTDTLL